MRSHVDVLVMFFPITHENKCITVRSPSVFHLRSRLGKLRPLVEPSKRAHWASVHSGTSAQCLHLLPPKLGLSSADQETYGLTKICAGQLRRAAPGHRPAAKELAAGCPGWSLCCRRPSEPPDFIAASMSTLRLCSVRGSRACSREQGAW